MYEEEEVTKDHILIASFNPPKLPDKNPVFNNSELKIKIPMSDTKFKILSVKCGETATIDVPKDKGEEVLRNLENSQKECALMRHLILSLVHKESLV